MAEKLKPGQQPKGASYYEDDPLNVKVGKAIAMRELRKLTDRAGD